MKETETRKEKKMHHCWEFQVGTFFSVQIHSVYIQKQECSMTVIDEFSCDWDSLTFKKSQSSCHFL